MPQQKRGKKAFSNKRRGAQEAVGACAASDTGTAPTGTGPRPGPSSEPEAETNAAAADGEIRAGAMVKLCGLVKRCDLNGRIGFVEGRATPPRDDRWGVRLGTEDSFAEAGAGTGTAAAAAAAAAADASNSPNVPFAQLEGVRVRSANLCILDQILAHDNEGEPVAFQIRAGWNDPEDWNKSAAAVFYQLVRGVRLSDHFVNLQITVCARCDGVWHSFRPPPIVAARLPPDQETFWDGTRLLAAIRARLAADAGLGPGASPGAGPVPARRLHADVCSAPSVEQAAFDWAAPTDDAFTKSVARVIARAHTDASTVHVALRTHENTGRFTLLQALSGNDPASMNAALRIPGSMVLAPTECIVFHKDNMIKLPTSTMTIDQAARKVAQAVREGVDFECPICLDTLTSNEHSGAVFMPCSCKGGIHAKCLHRLRESGCVVCPLCRERIEPSAWGHALQ